MTDANNNNNTNEAALLASLGSTTADASTYESSILRNAKLRSAPQIELPHAEIARAIAANTSSNAAINGGTGGLVPCGVFGINLPDLAGMAPSTCADGNRRTNNNSAEDVPHLLTVLSKVRQSLHSAQGNKNNGSSNNEEDEETRKRNIDLLHMKEQLCLAYLHNVAGITDDDGIIPADHYRSNNKRRRRISSGGGKMDAADEYYGVLQDGDNGDDYSSSMSDAKKPAASKRGGKATSTASQPLSSSHHVSRLDQIKNGHQFNHPNNDNDNTTSTTKPLRKRNTIMSLKSQMRIDNGLTPLKSMDEERYDAEQSRKRREERKRRRLKRRRELLGLSSVGESSEEEEEEAEFVDESEKKVDDGMGVVVKDAGILKGKSKEGEDVMSAKKRGVRWAEEEQKVTKDSNAAAATKRSTTKVYCPICETILIFNNDEAEEEGEDTPDAFLSRHIAECQQSSGGRGRKTRTSRRKKKRIVDYADEDDVVDHTMDTDEIDESASTKKNSTDSTSQLDDESSTNNGTKRKESVYNPTSIDDMDEFDYEDRTDYWAKYGLKQMSIMAEQDSTEIPPGAEIYDGGLEIPAWVNNRLFPYQRIGVRWMWELHCQGAGGCVGDEMGLGKTVQVCSFLGAMAANRFIDSVLIVAPATMLAHWLSELSVWAPGLRRIMMHRSGETDGASRVVSKGMLRSLQKWLKNARSDRVNEAIDDEDYNEKGADAFCGSGYAIVTTYESIRRAPDDWVNHNWSYVVLDEGQKIRNPDADVTLACKRLRTPHRLLLSGTPIQNDLRELWSLFDFIFPGRLGTLPAFEAEFAVPIKRGGYSNASPMQVQLAYRCSLVLRDLINPYLLRRQKKDVKEVNRMPGKTEQVLFCRLSPKQRRMYEEFLRSDDVMGVMRGSANLLGAVTTLRKICNHTSLVANADGSMHPSLHDDSSSSDDEFYEEDDAIADQSGKLQVLSKILPLWKQQGHKVIIFTQWRKMLDIIERFSNMQGWKYARMDGNTNVAARQRLVDNFNNDENYFCMLMTTKTGGVGLNITGANRVLLYDPDWNPQTDAQARERAWRFGQKRDVTVYRLITAGTIEEKIYQRQIFKTALSNQVLQDPKQRRLFSQKDLKDLFTLKADTKDITETGEITRGKGVVDVNMPDEAAASENNDEEQAQKNNNTLEVVMKSKGLCGVFDHDFVENSSSKKKSISEKEMEHDAKKTALKAVASLQESSKNLDRFMPTWTGSEETKQPPLRRADNSFGNAPAAAAVSGAMMSSSSALLANLQQKRMQIASSSQKEEPDADSKKNSELLLRLRKYLRRRASNGGGPTTRELLKEFKDVPDSDAAVFRKMLKSVAVIKNGQWILR
ncbi:RAD54-like protein [Skeletonema marinoi]|uniref:RAD54-like protein n=1 Tax=Skeletonema marinoi TaxID=267567 RepID=A0AAD9DDU5_9STRA|nr:RAD54-like protein [Skeletonema marinoi]